MRNIVTSVVVCAGIVGLFGTPVLAEDAAPSAAPAAAAEMDADLVAALKKEGATVYFSSCQSCHGAAGAGGAGPALASNPNVDNTPELLRQVLKGGSYMPPMGALSDREIAAVTTYIRTGWGNTSSPISEADVAAAR